MKKTLIRTAWILMVLQMLIISVTAAQMPSFASENETYTLTVESTYADSFTADSSNPGVLGLFADVEFNGCYGNQLADVAKELYDSMVKQFATEVSTGEYSYTFENEFRFPVEVSGGNIILTDDYEEVRLIIEYAMQTALDAFLYDHPDVFWLRKISTSFSISAKGNSYSGYTGTISSITIVPEEIYSDASENVAQFNEAVESVYAEIVMGENRYDTLRSIHDYICNNARYNLSGDHKVHTAEPFFLGDGGIVCEGYAKTFKILCDSLNIPCVLVSGDAGGAHMWNYVQMDDGKWYLVDVTWDDQISGIFDTYFLANANTIGFNSVAIREERTENSDFSGSGVFSFIYPVLSSSTYTVHDHIWDSEYTVDKNPSCTEEGSKSRHCTSISCTAKTDITVIPVTHSEVQVEPIPATCTDVGYTAGVFCSNCEIYISGHEEIPALGHIEGEWIVERDANCTTVGKEVLQCARLSAVQYVNIPAFEDIDNSAFIDQFTACAATWLNASITGEVKYGTLSLDTRDYMAERLNPMLYATRDNGEFTGIYRDIWTSINNGTTDSEEKGKTVNCITLCNMIIMGIPYEGSRLNGHENILGMSGYAFDVCKLLEAPVDSDRNVIYNPTRKLGINTFERILTISSFFDTYTNLGLAKTVKTKKSGTDGELWYNEIRPGDVLWTGSHTLFCLSVSVDGSNVTVSGIDATTLNDISNFSFTVTESGAVSGINKRIKKVARPIYSEYSQDSEYSCSRMLEREISVDVENHSWSSGNITTNATCSEAGIITYTCEYNSSHMKTESSGVDPSAHEYLNNCDESCNLCGEIRAIAHDYNAATCTAPMTCKVCGETSGSTIAHSYLSQVTSAATCVETGIRTYNCSSCTDSYTEIIEKTAHSYSTSYKVDKNATCLEEGSESRHCATIGCSEKTDETLIPKLAHTEVDIMGVAATCVSEGLTDGKKCSVCDTITLAQQATPKAAHTEVDIAGVVATCTAEGLTDGKKCSECGTVTVPQQTIAKKAHAYTEMITKAATCIATGTKTFTCSCGDAYTETIDKTVHSYSASYTVDKNATCTAEGSKSKHCTTSGCTSRIDAAVITKIAHKEVGITGKAATCTNTGLTDGKKCSVCGKVTLAQQSVKKTAHKEVKVTGKAATCTTTGLTEGKKCSVCNAVTLTQNTISAKGHDYSAVTCTAPKTCKVCGATSGSKLEHKYDNACDTTCNVCKAARKITHNYAAATCTKAKTCKECKATTGKANGHKYTNACDKSCNVCKATRTIKHTYKTVTTKATLKKNGKVETKCSVCGYVSKTTTIFYPKTIKLSTTSYTYNGKVKTPTVTVKDSKGNTLKKDTDYTVKYEGGRKSTGKYTVKVTFKGKYSGTKTLSFNILPSKTGKITPTCYTTKIKASWSKVTGAGGYKVELLNSKGKVVKTVTTTKTSYTFEKLSKVTTYKVRVTAYKTIDGKKVYSKSSTTITTATAPGNVTLSKVTAGKNTAAPVWKTVTGASGYQVQYSTSKKHTNAKIATVIKGSSTKTTLKKLTKGKTYYIKVRAFKTVDGKKVYGAWSTVKSVKVK